MFFYIYSQIQKRGSINEFVHYFYGDMSLFSITILSLLLLLPVWFTIIYFIMLKIYAYRYKIDVQKRNKVILEKNKREKERLKNFPEQND